MSTSQAMTAPKVAMSLEARVDLLEARLKELEDDFARRLRYTRSYLAGELARDRLELKLAVRHLKSALAEYPGNKDCLIALGRTYTYMDEIPQASEIFSQLLEIYPDDPAVLRASALNCRFSTPNEAVDLLDKAFEHVQDSFLRVRILNEKGLLFRDLGRFNEALQCHLQARESGTDEPFAEYFLGICYWVLEREAEARKCLSSSQRMAGISAEIGAIKQIWAQVIRWSCEYVTEAYDAAARTYSQIETALVTPYMRNTILSHVECVKRDHFRLA